MKRFLFPVLLLLAKPAFANHPGERIDEVMAEQEPAFEVADRPSTPELSLEEPGGNVLRLGDLHNQIVVLSFVPQNCDSPCSKQQARSRRRCLDRGSVERGELAARDPIGRRDNCRR